MIEDVRPHLSHPMAMMSLDGAAAVDAAAGTGLEAMEQRSSGELAGGSAGETNGFLEE